MELLRGGLVDLFECDRRVLTLGRPHIGLPDEENASEFIVSSIPNQR